MRRTIRLAAPIGALVLVSAGVVGTLDASAGAGTARTVDCGTLAIPAAGASPFRFWAKGTDCPSGKKLLSSDAVAHGLPKDAFVPPKVFKANGFTCGYDLATIICWVGPTSAKHLTLKAFHQAAARSSRVVSATPVELQVSAPDERAASVKVIRFLAAKQGKTLSASVSAWKGGCEVDGDRFLPGVPTSNCILFDTKHPSACIIQVFLYRTSVSTGTPPTSWRWDAIGGTIVSCQ
jgi:hypothetical protein